jgi:hypothetical protein
MATDVRKTGKRDEFDALIQRVNALANRCMTNPGIADGGTDGKLQTANSISFSIDGELYTKAGTDNLWDLTAQTDTIAAQYRAYALYLDSSGTASIGAGSNAASAAAALAALPAFVATKCVVGVYVAGPSCDFNGAAGLEAQGTVHNGTPSGAVGGLDVFTSVAP